MMITTGTEESKKLQTTTTLMVCIDAFSKTYLSKENTPFMFEMANTGINSTIEPLFAFRGIETTMFTGVWPDVHGTWTEISLRRDTSNSAKLGRSLVSLLDLLAHDKVRKIGRVIVQRLLDRSSVRLTPNLIPAEAFGFFEPSQNKAIHEAGSVNLISTIFDLLRQKNLAYAFIEPPIFGGDRRVIDKIARLVNSGKDTKLWYVKFGKPDKEGHKYGPRPEFFQNTLREIDNYVRQTVSILKRRYSELNIVILADHGMSNVDTYHDILGGLTALKSKIYKDYVPFLDSTMARFWFSEDNARIEITNYLNSLDYGHILSSQEMKALHVPDQERYGELIFVVDEGKMLYPDFWSGTRKAKGMHGYAFPSSSESVPVFIANKEMSFHHNNERVIKYVDLFNMLKNSISV